MEQLEITITITYSKLGMTDVDVANVFAWLSAKKTAASGMGAIEASTSATWLDVEGQIVGLLYVTLQKNPFTSTDISNVRTWISTNINGALPVGCTSRISYVWRVLSTV